MRPFHLLAAAALLACAPRLAPSPGEPVPSVVDGAARELPADRQVHHVLARLAFGPRPGDVERVRAMGVDRWIERQLHPERIADPAADRALAAYETLALSGGALLERFPPPQRLRARLARSAAPTAGDSLRLREARRAAARVGDELQSARVARAVTSERQLLEVMTDFWENHFNVHAAKGPQLRYYLPEYDRTIRAHALGRFRDLLGAVAHSPAMLIYLDNWQSRADSGAPTIGGRGRRMARAPRRGLNENYARELLELHTLGVDGGYTQDDVVAVARAFTGWSVRPAPAGGGFVFLPGAHDGGEKWVLGQRLPAGRGEADGEAVLDLLARHPSTARHVAEKLARRFVSDTPPPALVERAAESFRRTDGDMRAVVRTIVTSPEMFAASAYRSKVKTPFEVVVSAARALGAPADPTPRTARFVARLGQPLWGHQAPDGWPETGEAWMNAGAILARINFGLDAGAGRLPGASLATLPDAARLARGTREEQVDGVVAALLGGAASPETRAVLLTGAHPLLARERETGMPTSRPPAPGTLAQVVGLALGSPEFQRR